MAELEPPRPLAEDDDRLQFDCGRDSLNTWFRRHAWANQASAVSRTNVVCMQGAATVSGFVALSAAQIERAHLPRSAQRNRPDPIPATLLGQLAVDQRFQNRGLARSLVFFALRTAVRVSYDIGSFGVLVHPLDDRLRQFYERFGFQTLPFDPGRSMIVRTVDLERAGF